MTTEDEARAALESAIYGHAAATDGFSRLGGENNMLTSFVVVAHWVDDAGSSGYSLVLPSSNEPRHQILGLLAVGEELLSWTEDEDSD